jgi:hypothetical protein
MLAPPAITVYGRREVGVVPYQHHTYFNSVYQTQCLSYPDSLDWDERRD